MVLEYAKDKMIIHVTSRDLLVVHNWQKIYEIIEGNAGNTMKFWIAPIPGFDEKTFPFLICNGWESYNLINLKDLSMQVLIKASGKNTKA